MVAGSIAVNTVAARSCAEIPVVVFERLPDLRVTLLECGFAWLPPLLWRFDKDWKGLWREVPWVKEPPSGYVRRHIRATTAPAHIPHHPEQLADLLERAPVEEEETIG